VLNDQRSDDVDHRADHQQAGEKPPHPPALGTGLRPHTYLQRYGVF
jgi:hypothetical protein